jgi:hypothetical protein
MRLGIAATGGITRRTRDGESLVNAFPKQQSTIAKSELDPLYDVRDQGVG